MRPNAGWLTFIVLTASLTGYSFGQSVPGPVHGSGETAGHGISRTASGKNPGLPTTSHQPEIPQVLTGQVLCAGTGEPLPGAVIFLPDLNRGTAAAADGRFRLEAMRPGRYRVEIRFVGYETQTLHVVWPDLRELHVSLKPEILQADDVIVTASPLGRTIRFQPAQALNRAQLHERAAPSIGEMLDGSPGVAMRSFGSAPARPVIRGLDGERVLVMENGERMGDLSSTAHDHAVALDPLAIERVEVVRGPASLLYGSSALGGVVNLFSRDLPQEWSPGSGGTFLTQAATVNGLAAGLVRGEHKTDRMALTGSVSYRKAGDLRTPAGRLQGTFLESYSGSGGFGYRTGNLETGLSVRGMKYDYGLPAEPELPGGQIDIRMNRSNFQSFSILQMKGLLKQAELRLSGGVYHHEEVERKGPAGSAVPGAGIPMQEELQLGFEQQNLGANLLLQHQPVLLMEGTAGISIQGRSVRIKGKNRLLPGVDQLSAALFVFEQAGLTPWLTAQAGGRMELQRQDIPDSDSDRGSRTDWIASGSAGLNIRPAGGWETGIQLARAYRVPTIEELYSDAAHHGAGAYEIGDPELGNEVSMGADLFVHYTRPDFSVEGALFLSRISGFIKYSAAGRTDASSGLPVFTYSAVRARLYGLELTVKGEVAPGLRAQVTMDYIVGSEISKTITPLPFMPPLRMFWSLRYDRAQWWSEMRLRGVLAQNRTAPGEESTPGYLLPGLNAGYSITEGLSLIVRLDNALNTSYRDHLSRIEDRNRLMPGRNLNLMLKWDF